MGAGSGNRLCNPLVLGPGIEFTIAQPFTSEDMLCILWMCSWSRALGCGWRRALTLHESTDFSKKLHLQNVQVSAALSLGSWFPSSA